MSSHSDFPRDTHGHATGHHSPGAGSQLRDAVYRVDVAADRMSATLTVTPAHDGKEVDVADAMMALSQRGVCFGIEPPAVEAAVANPGTPAEVARGQAPQPAVDARMELLVNLNQIRHPVEDAKGRVDFRELGLIRSVEVDTPLMRRHPPQPGQPGRTVLGAEIAVRPPKDAKFSGRMQGVQFAPNDMDLLVAAIPGQPVLGRDGLSVEPVLVLPSVNLASGNVDFVGTVEIKGDVQGGMKIKADGDVIVHGIIESADVEAAGDVVAKGGIVGQKHQMQGGGGADKTFAGARIRAKANVRAHHIENAFIFAELSVYVDEAVVQSDVTAIERVIIGREGGHKGHVLGGTVRATLGITAVCLGGPGTGATHVMIGVNPLLQKALDEKHAEIAAKRKALDDLDKVVRVLQARTDRLDMLTKAHLTYDKTEKELADATAEAEAMAAELKRADKATVVVKRAVFPGVSVTIGGRRKLMNEQRGPGLFRLATETVDGKDEEVVIYE
ncbi:MAG: FapA family protein [Sterolibacteriaceae bacterium MAG5]|nr:FapA family protein [Candidatus Nitricoxidireducens bremensis]